MAKAPKAAFQPSPKKVPHTASLPKTEKRPRMPQVRGGPLVWRFSSIDRDGPFAWSALDDPAAYKEAMEKLHQFETMEETAIRAQGSHPVEVWQLCKEAQNRLAEIELDDLDALMSFRLTGARRVWCRMDNNMMLVLWWDPGHAVCPSPKKHT
ncbi:hypothetical protein [Magnetospirillum molischianum]|uniref:Uncharacterized protein n=1 Tax=Magnetospirillum molischianum DSM 120 TaxID=1150626 RepID=H8FTW9_MAGML|nr:hypothetical protein [Magnetospirillum molischianum]CCG41826.1 conserved hypothetical protein [Magnetospirillum molischianum DSM 120]